MRSPARDIAEKLQGEGFGTVGKDIMVSRVPDAPDDVVVVSCVTSREAEIYTAETQRFLESRQPNIQIYARGKAGKNKETYNTVESIRSLLHGCEPFEVDGTMYYSIFALSDIGELGVDEKIRPVFSINFRTRRSDK